MDVNEIVKSYLENNAKLEDVDAELKVLELDTNQTEENSKKIVALKRVKQILYLTEYESVLREELQSKKDELQRVKNIQSRLKDVKTKLKAFEKDENALKKAGEQLIEQRRKADELSYVELGFINAVEDNPSKENKASLKRTKSSRQSALKRIDTLLNKINELQLKIDANSQEKEDLISQKNELEILRAKEIVPIVAYSKIFNAENRLRKLKFVRDNLLAGRDLNDIKPTTLEGEYKSEASKKNQLTVGDIRVMKEVANFDTVISDLKDKYISKRQRVINKYEKLLAQASPEERMELTVQRDAELEKEEAKYNSKINTILSRVQTKNTRPIEQTYSEKLDFTGFDDASEIKPEDVSTDDFGFDINLTGEGNDAVENNPKDNPKLDLRHEEQEETGLDGFVPKYKQRVYEIDETSPYCWSLNHVRVMCYPNKRNYMREYDSMDLYKKDAFKFSKERRELLIGYASEIMGEDMSRFQARRLMKKLNPAIVEAITRDRMIGEDTKENFLKSYVKSAIIPNEPIPFHIRYSRRIDRSLYERFIDFKDGYGGFVKSMRYLVRDIMNRPFENTSNETVEKPETQVRTDRIVPFVPTRQKVQPTTSIIEPKVKMPEAR